TCTPPASQYRRARAASPRSPPPTALDTPFPYENLNDEEKLATRRRHGTTAVLEHERVIEGRVELRSKGVARRSSRCRIPLAPEFYGVPMAHVPKYYRPTDASVQAVPLPAARKCLVQPTSP